jgi:Ca-activated chloride channel family protein
LRVKVALLGLCLGCLGLSIQEQSQPIQKQEIRLREVHAIITDQKDHSLDDITKEDIQLIQDGVPQTIESFSLLDMPIRYGLVIDTSGSLRSQFPRVIQTSKNLVARNRSSDATFVARFVDSTRINLVREMTANKEQLLASLGTLKVEGGQTALIDAVYATAEYLIKLEAGSEMKYRKALVLITDGEDRNSFYKSDQLFKMLRNKNLKIFVIGLVQELDNEGGFSRKAPRERALELIGQLTKTTGGRAFFPNKAQDFERVVDELSHDLQKQYVLSYRPEPGAIKKEHEVQIKVSDTPDKRKRQALLKSKYSAEDLEGANNR